VQVTGGASNNTIGGTAAGAGNVISGNLTNGIELNASGNLVEGNFIGTNAAGTAALGNSGDGVSVTAAANTIGGTVSGAGNLISGNAGDAGILLQGTSAGSNLVVGNLIGTQVGGLLALGNGNDGIDIQSSGNTIGGTTAAARNVITSSGNVGIAFQVSTTTGNLVEGNYIGVGSDGVTALGNKSHAGVEIFSDGGSETIGGTAAGAGNLIAGNTGDGIRVLTSANLVEGNLIGTNVTGNAALANTSHGIEVGGASNTIGGTTASAGNLISANQGNGINIDTSSGNLVQGNRIGTNAAGTAALANQLAGVAVLSSSNTIGGTTAGAHNVVSGNVQVGVFIMGSAASGNLVQGNYIGTDVTGNAPLGNGFQGVILNDAPNNTIGGSVTGAGNIISANTDNGVAIAGTAATGDQVQGNLIGVGANGTSVLGNGLDGVYIGDGGIFNPPIQGSASNALIGGTTATARNVIANNGNDGVLIAGSGATGIVVEGNYIGADATGMVAAPNKIDGVEISGGATNDTIGGTVAGAGNVISGNKNIGVDLDGTGTTGNLVADNLIGTNAAGNAALANASDGVQLTAGASNNTIGGTVAAARNVISGNGSNGIFGTGTDVTQNLVEGNFIGTNAAGTAALGNTRAGVGFSAPNNTVGSAVAGGGNVISGNGSDGVSFNGTSGGLVQGNLIGTDMTGTVALANQGNGVSLSSAGNITVGGTTGPARNVIAANQQNGVFGFGSGTSGNLVEGNYIGTNAAGTAALGNLRAGVSFSTGNNSVGGAVTGAGNVISGNGLDGVSLNALSGGAVQGNLIGTDANGMVALGNQGNGVSLANTGNITIGGTTAAARNIIAANKLDGINASGTGATGNLIEGNYVGTTGNGMAALANGAIGVELTGGASSNTIGGSVPGAGNVLSGNTAEGLRITGSATTANLVQGTLIGTNAAGTAAVANKQAGIFLNGTSGNTIGGMAAGARNVISGNSAEGIFASGGSASNLIQNNLIGTDITGNAALGNPLGGIFLGNSPNNTVGGTTGGAGNVISGNGASGVVIVGSSSTGDVVQGNLIGLGADGTTSLGNALSGVSVGDGSQLSPPFPGSANQIVIGGVTSGARNVISGNANYGININGSGATGITVQGNYVGTDTTGSLARSNAFDGIIIRGGASNDTIGGTAAGAGNVISGNSASGVEIDVSGILVQGNLIGTQADGASALGNAQQGVFLHSGASQNTIGGTVAGAGNTIAFNGGAGVLADSGTGNTILSDSIFNNTGLGIQLTNGANSNPPIPVVTLAQPSGTGTAVAGTLMGAANTRFAVQLFANPRNFQEGKTLLGTITVTTDASGKGSFNMVLGVAFAAGQFTTATATDPNGNTSEFSVALPPPGSLTATGVPVCAVVGVAFTNLPVAEVTITGMVLPATAYTATITWGDGTPTTAAVLVLSGNTLTVQGSHTYTTEGSFTVQVTVNDTAGHSASVTTTASVFGYISSLYQEVLNRAPDTAGLAFWLGVEQTGVSRTLIAQAFLSSAEHRGIEVDQFYQKLLHRPADAAGRALWVNALLAGASENAVAVAFLISPEYTAEHPDAVSYVTGLYEDVLGRPPDATGFSFWSQVLANGARSRADLAYYFLTSGEAYVDAIDEYYRNFLGRNPSLQEEQGYLASVLSGQATPASLTAIFLGSPEFLSHQLAVACNRMT
jgi:hypothetical protein